MTDREMQKLLEEIQETQQQFLAFRTKDQTKPPRIQFSEPANEDELNQLSTHLARHNLEVPPSYRQFLRISNGIVRFRWEQSFSLRSTQRIIQQSLDDESWDDLAEDYSELDDADTFGPVHRFIIGTGDITVVCAFDPDTVDEFGEMKIIEFDIEANPPKVHDNFEAFLRSDLTIYQQDLAREMQDRKDLADD